VVVRASLVVASLLALAGCAEIRGARLYQRGTLALDRGDPVAAVDDLEAAARLVPQASEIQNHLGLAYLAAGREGEARVAFEQALVLDCDNRAARANLAALVALASDGHRPIREAAPKQYDPEIDLAVETVEKPETSDAR